MSRKNEGISRARLPLKPAVKDVPFLFFTRTLPVTVGWGTTLLKDELMLTNSIHSPLLSEYGHIQQDSASVGVVLRTSLTVHYFLLHLISKEHGPCSMMYSTS